VIFKNSGGCRKCLPKAVDGNCNGTGLGDSTIEDKPAKISEN
jgi:hypothetical protein